MGIFDKKNPFPLPNLEAYREILKLNSRFFERIDYSHSIRRVIYLKNNESYLSFDIKKAFLIAKEVSKASLKAKDHYLFAWKKYDDEFTKIVDSFKLSDSDARKLKTTKEELTLKIIQELYKLQIANDETPITVYILGRSDFLEGANDNITFKFSEEDLRKDFDFADIPVEHQQVVDFHERSTSKLDSRTRVFDSAHLKPKEQSQTSTGGAISEASFLENSSFGCGSNQLFSNGSESKEALGFDQQENIRDDLPLESTAQSNNAGDRGLPPSSQSEPPENIAVENSVNNALSERETQRPNFANSGEFDIADVLASETSDEKDFVLDHFLTDLEKSVKGKKTLPALIVSEVIKAKEKTNF